MGNNCEKACYNSLSCGCGHCTWCCGCGHWIPNTSFASSQRFHGSAWRKCMECIGETPILHSPPPPKNLPKSSTGQQSTGRVPRSPPLPQPRRPAPASVSNQRSEFASTSRTATRLREKNDEPVENWERCGSRPRGQSSNSWSRSPLPTGQQSTSRVPRSPPLPQPQRPAPASVSNQRSESAHARSSSRSRSPLPRIWWVAMQTQRQTSS